MQTNANAIDDLAVFPFMNDLTILSQLKVELPEYLAKAEDVSSDMAPLEWWARQNTAYLTGQLQLIKIILIQLFSAAVERVFNLLKASFNECQDGTHGRSYAPAQFQYYGSNEDF